MNMALTIEQAKAAIAAANRRLPPGYAYCSRCDIVQPVEHHDDRPDDCPDLHVSTGEGDLDCAGRPLRPGT